MSAIRAHAGTRASARGAGGLGPPSKSVDRFCMSPFWASGQRALGFPLFEWFWPTHFDFFTEANIEFLQLKMEKFEKIYNLLTEYNYLTASVIVTRLKRPQLVLMFCTILALMMIRMITSRKYYNKVLLVILRK